MVDHKTMLVIGNGNSTRLLAKLGFHNIPSHIDTFGMGLAYRLFHQLDWWPTYYACCDMKVVHSNRKDLERLLDDPTVMCEHFFFPLPLRDSSRMSLIPHSSTGDFCVKESVRRGYKYILFIGMDRDYQEVIPQARELTAQEFQDLGYVELLHDTDPQKVGRELLIIDEDPAINTNYFFDSYQRQGDVYSLPKAGTSHKKAWEKLFGMVAESESQVFDLSPLRPNARPSDLSLVELCSLDESTLADRLSRQAQKDNRGGLRGSIRRWLTSSNAV